MTTDKLNGLIAKEKAKLEKLVEKRNEIDEQIKQCEVKLNEYEMMANSQKYDALASVVKQSGLALEDVVAALKNGDLLGLQERMEAAQKAEIEAEKQFIESIQSNEV